MILIFIQYLIIINVYLFNHPCQRQQQQQVLLQQTDTKIVAARLSNKVIKNMYTTQSLIFNYAC
uniref:Uncharacterized protein n=1 Tax=Lymantria dispar multicapsid nuclear polyhedrosis virus TaxID=10449 RepID=A0A1B1MQS8_NPVLD|nr:hypothetical protein [Lymantria dispar multiple nucleopolyhedrovirus]